VGVCSLSYPAYNANAPYYTAIFGLSVCTVFFHTIREKKGEIFGRKFFFFGNVFWFSLQMSFEIFLILRRVQRGAITKLHQSSCKSPFILVRVWRKLNVIDFLSKKKSPNIKFYEQISIWIGVLTRGRTDRHTDIT
jgi:hypothetical protein